jgi:hypothetical protein
MPENRFLVNFSLSSRLACDDRFAVKKVAFALVPFLLSAIQPTRADDGAASVAAGGVVLMTREPRIVMAKEVLHISPSKVAVDYEFRNDTDEAITTTVAFPIPSYKLQWDRFLPQSQGFDDFQLTVDGKPAHFMVQVAAKLGQRDVTNVLKKYGIDIATFGHFDVDRGQSTDIEKLSSAQRKRLVEGGLIEPATYRYEGTWRVEKKYYWTQVFPAHSTTRVSHRYTPVIGNSNTIGDPAHFRAGDREAVEEYASVCPSPELRRSLARVGNSSIFYVDFILTTANTWKTPIEDFTLIVERSPGKDRRVNDVSFCWDGPVTKIDANHFSAHVAGLVPRKELRIGYITSDEATTPIKPPKP